MAPERRLPPAIDGTQERLDIIIEELRALRAEIAQLRPQPPEPPAGEMALREPAKTKKATADRGNTKD